MNNCKVDEEFTIKDYGFLRQCLEDEQFKAKKSNLSKDPFLKEGFDKYDDYIQDLIHKIDDKVWAMR